jgi:hypothetical protein
MQRDCKLPRKDKKNNGTGDSNAGVGDNPRPADRVPRKPAAALTCKGDKGEDNEVEGCALAASDLTDESDIVLFDSCSTHHVVMYRKFLTNFTSRSDVTFMRMGGNRRHRVHGQGIAVLENGPSGPVVLQNVLLVPTMI